MENFEAAAGTAGDSRDDLVVVLVGLTANWRKRRYARAHFTKAFGRRVYLPWLPYIFGLRASAAWLSFGLRRRIARTPDARLQVVAYIGGGVLLRMLHAKGQRWPIGRVVWDRSAPQERVAPALTARVPAALLTLAGYRTVVDLARLDVSKLDFPQAPGGAGLIVETGVSRLARRLDIEPASSELSPEAAQAMLPGARAVIVLPLSHDEVYEDARFLDEAVSFLKTGAFQGAGDQVRA